MVDFIAKYEMLILSITILIVLITMLFSTIDSIKSKKEYRHYIKDQKDHMKIIQESIKQESQLIKRIEKLENIISTKG